MLLFAVPFKILLVSIDLRADRTNQLLCCVLSYDMPLDAPFVWKQHFVEVELPANVALKLLQALHEFPRLLMGMHRHVGRHGDSSGGRHLQPQQSLFCILIQISIKCVRSWWALVQVTCKATTYDPVHWPGCMTRSHWVKWRGELTQFSPPPPPQGLSLNHTKSINSLWPSDAIWQQGCGSRLAQVMPCCRTAPSLYLNQVRSCGIHLRAISPWLPKLLFCGFENNIS